MFWRRVPRRWTGVSECPTTIMSPADEAELSVDGWQPNEDAVMKQSQRLVLTGQCTARYCGA